MEWKVRHETFTLCGQNFTFHANICAECPYSSPSNALYGNTGNGSPQEKDIQIMSQLTRKYPDHHEQQNMQE